MKRMIALVLALTLVASFLVLPASAGESPEIRMSVVAFEENKADGNVTEITGSGSHKAGDLIALKFEFVNNATARWLYTFGTRIKFDSSAVAPYSFESDDEESIGPFVNELGGITVGNPDSSGIIVSAAMTTGKKVAANATRKIGYVLFRVVQDVESGSIEFNVDETFNNQLIDSTVSNKDTEASPNKEISFSGIKAEASVTGQLPTLGSIEVKLKEGTGVYGAPSTFQLTALSTKGKDITNLVTFGVKDPKSNVVTSSFDIAADGTLDIGTHDAGTYTVWADPIEGQCTYPTTGAFAPQATFEITPKPITSATVTVTGFGKGQPVKDAKATAANMTVACGWYTGEGTPGEDNVATGKFAANSPYTLTLILTPNKNYNLADNTTVTVEGLDSQKTASLTIHENSGVAIVTATTGAKDATKRASGTNLFADSSRYGNTLSSVNLTAEANKDGYLVVAYVGGKETTTKVPGKFEWKNPAEKVGNVGNNSHTVVFTPDKPFDELYVGFEAQVNVRVDKKVLNLDETKLIWSGTNLPYTGEEQTVTATPTADIAEYVNVTYDNETEGHTNTAINAGSYTAAAVVTPKDANNISLGGATAEEQESRTFTKEWKINKADLTPTSAEKSVIYGTPKVIVTLADLGLTQSGIEIFTVDSTTSETNPLITGTQISDNKQSVEFTLRPTAASDANSVQGTATVTFTSTNYNVADATVTIKIVNKHPVTLTVTGSASSFPYGTTSDAIKDTLTINNAPAGVDLTYTYTDAAGNPVNNISEATPAKGYVVTISGQDAANVYTGTYTFEITKLDLKDATIKADGTLTYNRSEQTQNVIVEYNRTAIASSHYTVTGNTRTNAGTQTLTVTANTDSALYTGFKTFDFTIAKATPTVDDFEVTRPTDAVYDGNKHPATVAKKYDDIGTMTVLHNGDRAFPKDAGDYTVTIRVEASDNYTDATLNNDSWTFSIGKATIAEAMVGSIGDLTYTGEALTPALSVADLTAGTDYEVAYTNNTDAGTATATVTGKGNYEGTIVRNFTIKPAKMSFAANVYVSSRTNVLTQQTVELQPITGVKGETLTPAVTLEAPSSADDIFTVAPAYDATTGSVTFTLNGTAGSATYKVKLASPNKNYAPGEYNLVFTASHRTAIAITFMDGSATYTGSPIRYGTASAGESGTWTYTYAPVDGSGASLDADTRLPLTVGTYKVTAHFENADHIGDKTVTFVINKATPAAPAEIKVDNTDTTLGELGNKMLVEIGVPGTIHWYGPDGKPITEPHNTKIEANTEYSWEFIPADGYKNNYNGIGGKTTPYVRDDLSWLPGVLGGGSSFSFHDVTRFDYYYDSVKWAADNGIASGTSRFAFSPDAVCTRAQTVTFLWRAAGSPLPRYRVSPFTDVHAYDYYYEAVLWAVEQGITTGLTATTFGPDETVTRGQVATFLYRAASAAKPNTFNPFTDVKPTAYNYGAILWAYDNRITTGTSTTTFSPDAFCTRAQIVTFLYRYYQGR